MTEDSDEVWQEGRRTRTDYSDEVNERYAAIMTDYDERSAAIHGEDSIQQQLDLTASTWQALVAAGITERDADHVLGVFGF